MENKDHVKVSLRSKGNFDTNVFAQKYYNGGGHVNASGGKAFKSLDETINEFESILKKSEE